MNETETPRIVLECVHEVNLREPCSDCDATLRQDGYESFHRIINATSLREEVHDYIGRVQSDYYRAGKSMQKVETELG